MLFFIVYILCFSIFFTRIFLCLLLIFYCFSYRIHFISPLFLYALKILFLDKNLVSFLYNFIYFLCLNLFYLLYFISVYLFVYIFLSFFRLWNLLCLFCIYNFFNCLIMYIYIFFFNIVYIFI